MRTRRSPRVRTYCSQCLNEIYAERFGVEVGGGSNWCAFCVCYSLGDYTEEKCLERAAKELNLSAKRTLIARDKWVAEMTHDGSELRFPKGLVKQS